MKLQNVTFGYLFGAVYVLVGLVGFAVTGGVDFAASRGEELIVFGLNPLHNLAHIAVGLALVGAARAGEKIARLVNSATGAALVLLGAAGLFLVGTSVNILAINHADNALHIALGLVTLAVALPQPRPASPRQRCSPEFAPPVCGPVAGAHGPGHRTAASLVTEPLVIALTKHPPTPSKEARMATSLRCADAGFDCPAVFITHDHDELMEHVALHAKHAHPEVPITPELVDQVEKLVRSL